MRWIKPFGLVFFGAIALYVGVALGRAQKLLKAEGREAVVLPIKTYTEETKKRSADVSYKAEVAFRTASGELVSLPDVRLSGEEINHLLRGDGQVKIRYVPRDPKINSYYDRTDGFDMRVLGAVMLLAGLVWFRRNALVAKARPAIRPHRF